MAEQDSSSDDADNAIVMDLGTLTCKTGFAGDDSPRSIVKNVIGVPIGGEPSHGRTNMMTRIGDDPMSSGHVDVGYSWRYPLSRGIVTDWGALEQLWHHILFKDLRIKPEDFNLLVTEPALNPAANTEKLAQLAFEAFKFPAFFVVPGTVLSLYASGRVSGLVMDSGDAVTHTTAVVDGFSQINAINRVDFAGVDVTHQLLKLLYERQGLTFTTLYELNFVRRMKECVSYVAESPVAEITKYRGQNAQSVFRLPRSLDVSASADDLSRTYRLPDGSEVKVGAERFLCNEILFQPELYAHDAEIHCSLPEIVKQTLMKCPVDTRKQLSSNIVLSGSNTMTFGLTERLLKETSYLIPNNLPLKIIAPPERRSSAWIGGSILASLTVFQSLWLTRQHYDEYGPNIVHRCKLF